MKEVRATAKERMKGFCRVCPICDGRACVGEVPGMGGLGTGFTFKDNVRALDEVTFNMRLLHNAAQPDTRLKLLGYDLSLPVLAAPIGGVSFNMGDKITEEEYISAIVDGCAARGVIGCTGDGVPDFIHEAGLQAVKNQNGRGIPFIKPWEDEELDQKLTKCMDAGAKVVGIDIDAAGLITLRKMGRPVGPRPAEDWKAVMEHFPVDFIFKGIMTPDEARQAIDMGAAAIVVSNHGGRVLDYAPGTARVLPRIAEAVRNQIPVIVDGGIRTGGDVLKMLALGADAVMIGRPFSVAAVGGLEQGVTAYLDLLLEQLTQTMVLTGCPDLASANGSILHNAPK
ncbi:MAG: alpha-hydroxy-acid oxidizing protein [Desulfovibrio sp.]|uniref:alpha-hydroxy-acid oxidizing protein n=1 Tax=Desulfovibrio sp. 7SRBS1 TaxID=3378064 RepID=UPI003B3EB4DD